MDLRVTATTCEEICFWSIGPSPFLIHGKGTKLGAVGKANNLCSPIHLRVMLSQPGVTKDKIVMPEITDVEGDDFVMSIRLHGE